MADGTSENGSFRAGQWTASQVAAHFDGRDRFAFHSSHGGEAPTEHAVALRIEDEDMAAGADPELGRSLSI